MSDEVAALLVSNSLAISFLLVWMVNINIILWKHYVKFIIACKDFDPYARTLSVLIMHFSNLRIVSFAIKIYVVFPEK